MRKGFVWKGEVKPSGGTVEVPLLLVGEIVAVAVGNIVVVVVVVGVTEIEALGDKFAAVVAVVVVIVAVVAVVVDEG